MLKKLQEIKNRYHELEKSLADVSTPLSREERAKLMKEFASLGKTYNLYKQHQNTQKRHSKL